MNLPNILTMVRILLIPVFLIVFFSNFTYADQFSCFIFIAASVTDFFDGHLARKHNLVTNFGKIMDPLADKLLVLSALIALTVEARLPIWIVIIILARELGITSLRAISAGEGIIVAAGPWGKLKTVVQMIGIIMLLLSIPFALPVMYVAVLLTIISAVDYIIKLSKDITWM